MYAGKKIAYIRFWFNNYVFEDETKFNYDNYDNIKDTILCRLIMFVYTVDEKGKIGVQPSLLNEITCTINFRTDDLENMKLKYKDSEVYMREVADKLVSSNVVGGISYKDYIKKRKI